MVDIDRCNFLELKNNIIMSIFLKLFSKLFCKSKGLISSHSILNVFFFLRNKYDCGTNNNFDFFIQREIHSFKYRLNCRLAKMIPLVDFTWLQHIFLVILYTVALSDRNTINWTIWLYSLNKMFLLKTTQGETSEI